MAKDKGKKKGKKGKGKGKAEAIGSPLVPGNEAPAVAEAVVEGTPTKLSRKEFEKEMEKLQVELVKMQEWVKVSGAKICVLFEGRDTAGKGGVIKRITERVSPRVFRVVALSAPTEREKSQMYFQRYMPHLPAAGEVVLFDRSWYNRAGVERVMGFATKEQVENFLKYAPPGRESHHRLRHHPDQVLAGSGHGRAGQALPGAQRRLSQDLEAQPDGFARHRRAGTITPGRAMPCSLPPIPRNAPGTWCLPTTSAGRG